MGNRTSMLLFVAVAGLAVLLAAIPRLGLVDRGPIPVREPAPLAAGNAVVAERVQGPAVDLSEFTETVDRPLFAPDRRPVTEEEEAAPVEAPPVALEATTPPPLELSAVIIDGGRRVALFRSTVVAGSSHKAEEGGEVEGWTVSAVRPDGVTLERGGIRHEVALRTFKAPPAPVRPRGSLRRAPGKLPVPGQTQAQEQERGAGAAAVPQARPRRPLRGPRRRSLQRQSTQ